MEGDAIFREKSYLSRTARHLQPGIYPSCRRCQLPAMLYVLLCKKKRVHMVVNPTEKSTSLLFCGNYREPPHSTRDPTRYLLSEDLNHRHCLPRKKNRTHTRRSLTVYVCMCVYVSMYLCVWKLILHLYT